MRRPARRRAGGQSGQATVEFVLTWVGAVMPLTFAIIFTAQLLWIWHSVVDFTRDAARYAATHCYQGGGQNVIDYMRTHVPLMIDMDQFQAGQADLTVNYYSKDPDTGALVDFSCDQGDCSAACVPEVVVVQVSGYQFRRFVTYLGLPPIPIPDFRTSAPVESAGCDPEQGTCLP